MKKEANFSQQLRDYEAYQHQRRQDFLNRMEQKMAIKHPRIRL